MSSPPRSNMGRSKSPLASDKAFGKKNITPSKHKLELTTNRVARQANSPGSRQPKSPERSGTPNRNLSSIPASVVNASGKSGRPAENSPMRAVRVIDHSDSEALIDKLIKNREQLCSYLQLYDLLYANGAPLRCLTHNNFASLYCENEQKQLCVNCVYGNIQHKLHRVTPVKNMMPQIALDVDIMNRKVGKVVDGINQLEKLINQNIQDIDQQMTLGLKLLETEFERVQKAMLEKYAQIRETLLDNFSQARIKQDILLQQISVLKDIYADHSTGLPTSDDDPSRLYQHMVLGVLVNDSEKFDNRMLKRINGQQVRSKCLADLIKVRQLCQSMLISVPHSRPPPSAMKPTQSKSRISSIQKLQ